MLQAPVDPAGHRSRAPIPGHEVQQEPLHRQQEREQRAREGLGALQVLGGERRPPLLPALIGGLEEAHRLEVQDALVVGCPLARFGESALRLAIRIAGVVHGGELQPRIRIVGKAGCHVLKGASQPAFRTAVPPQELEEEAMALMVVGIGREARGHQVGEQGLGILDRPIQQLFERLVHLLRQELGVDPRMPRPSQGFEHPCAGEGLLPRPREIRPHAGVEVGDGGGRLPVVGQDPLGEQIEARHEPGHPPGRQHAKRQIGDCRCGQLVPESGQVHDLQQLHPREQRLLVFGHEGAGEGDEGAFDVAGSARADRAAEGLDERRNLPAFRPERGAHRRGSLASPRRGALPGTPSAVQSRLHSATVPARMKSAGSRSMVRRSPRSSPAAKHTIALQNQRQGANGERRGTPCRRRAACSQSPASMASRPGVTFAASRRSG